MPGLYDQRSADWKNCHAATPLKEEPGMQPHSFSHMLSSCHMPRHLRLLLAFLISVTAAASHNLSPEKLLFPKSRFVKFVDDGRVLGRVPDRLFPFSLMLVMLVSDSS